jgi:hypothetical protein
MSRAVGDADHQKSWLKVAWMAACAAMTDTVSPDWMD